MVVAALAVLALVSTVVFLHPWSEGDRPEAAAVSTSASGDSSTSATSRDTTTTTAIAVALPPVGSVLPQAAAFEGLSREGMPQSAFNAAWVVTSDEALDLEVQAADPGCIPLTGLVEGHQRAYSLAPPRHARRAR